MNEILFPILIFAGLGALAGILLLVASKLLYVEADETASKVLSCLPGANCGGCGYSGCEGYANAVAKGEAPTNLCKPGGADVMKNVSAVMGLDSDGDFVKEVAFVRCNGNCDATKDRFVYGGTQTCTAVNRFYNGKGECRFGCLGYGDCVNVCSNNAISIENGVAKVNPRLCGGCSKCVKTCPNHLIFMRKETDRVVLRCSSQDTGKATTLACKNGCIGCKICEKKCPSQAIVVQNNHAVVDYNKCTNCGTCVSACPKKCLVMLNECK